MSQESPYGPGAESKPLDQEKQDSLRAELITQITEVSSLEDFGRIKAASMKLDERTGYRMEIHDLLVERFEELMREKAKEFLA
jgi:hypothetical protein